MLTTTRRGFLAGITAFLAAPAIVRASSIMPIKAWAPLPTTIWQQTVGPGGTLRQWFEDPIFANMQKQRMRLSELVLENPSATDVATFALQRLANGELHMIGPGRSSMLLVEPGGYSTIVKRCDNGGDAQETLIPNWLASDDPALTLDATSGAGEGT